MPQEWISLFNKVARDKKFFYPDGPFYLLDLYQLAHGKCCGLKLQCVPLCAACANSVPMRADCLPWCIDDSRSHVGFAVNKILVQQIAFHWALDRGIKL